MARNKVKDGIKRVCDCEFADSGASVYQVMDMFFHEEIRSGWSAAVADEYDDSGYVEVNEGDVIVQFEGNIDDTNYRFIWAIDDDDAFGLVILAIDGDSLEQEEAEDLANTFAEQYNEVNAKKASKKGKGGSRNSGSRAASHFDFGAANSNDDDSSEDDSEEYEDDEEYDDEDSEDYEDDEDSECCGGKQCCCCDCDDEDDYDDEDYDEDDEDYDEDDDDEDDEDDEDDRSKRRRRR